jgi:hypothetical protein
MGAASREPSEASHARAVSVDATGRDARQVYVHGCNPPPAESGRPEAKKEKMMNGRFLGRATALCATGLFLIATFGCSSNVEKVGSSKKAEASGSASQMAQKAAPGMPAASTSASGPVVTMQGLTWDVAPGLKSEQPANTMRIAQYRIPSGKEGVKDGEIAVFFFGVGSGGGTQANLERWASQFTQADGGDPMAKAKVESTTSKGGLKVTTISLAGRYQSSGMGGGPSYDEPGWQLFGAVVEGQGGPWFFKAVGPETVIGQWRPRLTEMYKGLRLPS